MGQRIGVIGAGAMGSFFGYHLCGSAEVFMQDHDPAVVERIARDGLQVNDLPVRRVRIGTEAAPLFSVSILFLFVKAVDTLFALRPFAGELNPSTPVVSLQNGFGNEEAIKTAIGGAVPLVLGVTTESAVTRSPGSVHSLAIGSTILGAAGAAPATAQRVAGLLAASGLRASVTHDIRPHLWGKLIANAAINAVSALLECNVEEIPRNSDAAFLARALSLEAANVAEAMRIQLPFRDPWGYVQQVIAAGADSPSSMAFDLRSGHPSEVNHINGAIVSSGRRSGVLTPYNEAVLHLVRAKERAIGARDGDMSPVLQESNVERI